MPGIDWPLFVTATVLLTLTPGQDMLYVISRGLAHGRAAGVISAAGLTVGLAVYTLAAAFGLSAVLKTSELAFTVLKFAGAAYLLYIGAKLWRAAPETSVALPPDRAARRSMFWQGAWSALSNPKLALFFLAFLPQFVPAKSVTPTHDALALGLVFILIGIPLQMSFGFFAGTLSVWLRSRTTVFGVVYRASALVMVWLAVRLALAERR